MADGNAGCADALSKASISPPGSVATAGRRDRSSIAPAETVWPKAAGHSIRTPLNLTHPNSAEDVQDHMLRRVPMKSSASAFARAVPVRGCAGCACQARRPPLDLPAPATGQPQRDSHGPSAAPRAGIGAAEPKPIGAVGEIDEFGPSWRGIKARLLEDLPDGRGSDLAASERASSASQFSTRATRFSAPTPPRQFRP